MLQVRELRLAGSVCEGSTVHLKAGLFFLFRTSVHVYLHGIRVESEFLIISYYVYEFEEVEEQVSRRSSLAFGLALH